MPRVIEFPTGQPRNATSHDVGGLRLEGVRQLVRKFERLRATDPIAAAHVERVIDILESRPKGGA